MECRRFQDLADSYLAEELLVETNHDLIRHLESCPACREELAARRRLRTVLRSAFTGAEELRPAVDFEARVRARLRQSLAPVQAPRPRWFGVGRRWALAASLVIAGALTLHTAAGGWRPWPIDGWLPLSPTPPAGRALQEVAPYAAGDHEECAVNNRQPERLALEEAGRRYDPAYVGLVDVLQKSQPRTGGASPQLVNVVEGHSCVFQGRRFGHVTMTRAGRLASVLVTNVFNAPKAGLPRTPSRDSARRVNVCAPQAGFRVACFRAPQHAVFVVSDLGEQDNLALARSMAPALQRHLAFDRADAGFNGGGRTQYHRGLGELWSYSRAMPAVVVDDATFFDSAFGVRSGGGVSSSLSGFAAGGGMQGL